MSKLKQIIRYGVYRYPVLFDRIWQIYKTLRSRVAGVSYPRYFDSKADFLSTEDGGERKVVIDKRAVLVFMHWFETGGAESFALETIKVLHQKGHRVFTIATVPSAHSKIDWFRPFCEDVIDLNSKASFDKWYLFIADLIRQHSIGYIYIHHSSYAYTIAEQLKRDFPDIRIVDSTHIIEGFNGGFVHMSAEYSLWIDNHHVITPSLGSYYVNKFAISKRKISYFPLSYMSKDVGCSRTPYDYSGSTIKIVFLGRLAQQKRPYYFIEVAQKLGPLIRARGLIPQFEVYGDGPMKQCLEIQIAKKNLEDVKLRGESHNKDEIFRNTYALILPSENEGMPLVYFEATRYGVFSFATDVGQTKDFLGEEFLVSSFTPMKIVKKILLSLDQRDRYLELHSKQKDRLKKFDAVYKNGLAFEEFFYGSENE